MRRLIAILCVCMLATMNFAAGLDVDYRVSVRGGAIMPDGKVYKSAGLEKDGWVGPTVGAEFAVTFRPEWRSLQDWNNAGVGVAVGYWNLAFQKRLGHAITPYAYLDIPLVSLPHFVLGLRPGFGVGFLTKTYRNTVPDGHLYKDVTDANQSIGSVFNFYFPETFYMEFPLRRGWTILLGGGWYHLSNGSLVQPNSGYNIFAGELGVRYIAPSTYQPIVSSRRSFASRGLEKRWEVEAAICAGGRQVYYGDNQTFLCGEAQVAAYWRAHPIFRLGGGVDVFYDGAYVPRDTRFGKTDLSLAHANGSDCWRVGVSLQPEFVVGRFTAGFHVGAYLLDPVKKLEGRKDDAIFYSYDITKAGTAGYPDGWLYTQIVMRYRLPWHIFVQGAMKAHITKVEFVCLGLGVWL